MRLLINTASTFKGGGVQVAKSFLEECRKFPEHDYHVVLGKMLNKLVERDKFPANFSFYPIGYRPATRVFSFKNRIRFFQEIEAYIKPDVVFTTSGPAYWRPGVPHLTGYNLPHYIYRDSPYFDRISVFNRIKWGLKGRVIRYFFKHDSDAYVVQTEDVNERLRKWLSADSVYTVTNTCSSVYKIPVPSEKKLPEKKRGEFRFLTLSAWYGHKNLDIIPGIVEKLPENIRDKVTFILTLPKGDFRQHFGARSRDSILNIGPVKPNEGPSLYRECDALFLPTLLECFSASYAEAMAMERPIVTSAMGFSRSICQDAALYFKPADPETAASEIQTLVEDHKLRKKLVAAGKEQLKKFDTPEERAEKYLAICKKLIQ